MIKIDLTKPVFLNFNQSKFWEISLLDGNKSQIRYGKLVQGEEIEEKTQIVQKQHKDTDSCLDYIIRVIENKKLKGYSGDIPMKKNEPQIIIPANNASGFSIQISAPKSVENNANDDKDSKVDSNTQAYLQENKTWSSQFVILTLSGNEVEEIIGKLGIKKTWEKSSTILSANQCKLYFKNQIEEYERKGYVRDDSQYNFQLNEVNKHFSAQNGSSNNNQLDLNQKGKKKNFNKDSGLYDDSHSNISGISDQSDLTARSGGSQLDLSFDKGDDDDGNSSVVVTGEIKKGSLGANGSMDSGVLLAQAMPDEMDPTGWYASEKMDGVRAVWTGKTFYSRNGNEFYPPPFFIQNFPNCTLDGELFTKRDDFQRCVGIVKTKNGNEEKDERWKDIVYLVYDCPKLLKPFKDRIKALQEQIPKLGNKYIKVLPHKIVESREQLESELDRVLKNNGEGLMLRDPNSMYECRRSKTLLKVKTFTDEEATVIGSERGEGRCADMMGALVCRMKNGKEFKIGSGFNDDQRRRPPKKGSVITFKYQNLTKDGKPRFPIFLRIKEDE
ncbi:ATP-dependent DNA ligase (macronuclear) [Tetrahymena thermophila SB210]|uniref:ATP-dependent DNA ligase n=1 Tax=Tetrahymena thermophila (strain SB210) TaxID=312017 RepID=Q233G4_TETTS|nr:ATP-dependent DNA ligase [Tetrahymena thermophila SB210]EAR91616.1 ATP-dependent DNA ligase [Tetrahymena thermophila SB210]|eukprot:XP_001011861.1 ATP-dependent DNA ligase [Tetrahymena thermophila SB210]